MVGGFGNYFLPVQIGAPDYFKCLNKLYFYFNSINNDNYHSIKLVNVNTSKTNYIGPYLAGLFEGDGHIILSKLIDLKGKISYPYMAITFNNKNLPLVEKLIELFGGRLRFKSKENAIVWIINSHKELVNLINLVNGNMRTPKITQFNELIMWLNERYELKIPIYSVDTSDLNSNGWLAGFIDAAPTHYPLCGVEGGGFKIRYTEKRIDENSKKVLTKGRIEVRFALEQRLSYFNSKSGDFSYKDIMVKIQSFFGISTDLKTSQHKDKSYWIIEVTSLNKLNHLIQYLNNYPLLTCKRNDYDDWLKVYRIMVNKKHLTEDGKMLIKNIKSNINRKRTKFNFCHLIYLNNVQ